MNIRLSTARLRTAGWAVLALSLLIGSARAAPGDRQSPIDIQNRSTIVGHLPDIAPSYATRATLTLQNTDNPGRVPPLEREWATLRANVPPGSYVMVGHQQYNLLQFHFHTPSEHRVDGKAAPMEVHFVHLREGALPCDADALLVIGARIIRGARHAELDKIFALPALPFDAASAPLTIAGFDLTRVLPGVASSWRYPGSLTAPASFAPGCSSPEGAVEEQLASGVFPENVQWIVLTRSIEMSGEQIRRFKDLFEDGNSREPQPIGSRPVWRDLPGDAPLQQRPAERAVHF